MAVLKWALEASEAAFLLSLALCVIAAALLSGAWLYTRLRALVTGEEPRPLDDPLDRQFFDH